MYQISPHLFWLMLLAAIIVYNFPWIQNPGNSLSLSAFDFAEWTSLHPASYITSPILLSSLLLRFQLVLFTSLVSLNLPAIRFTHQWWLHTLAVILLVIAQIPPLEFISQSSNQNYQQQFFLTLLSLVIGIGSFGGWLDPYRSYFVIILCLFGIVTTAVGLSQGNMLMIEFKINTTLGIGGIVLAIIYGVYAAVSAVYLIKQTR